MDKRILNHLSNLISCPSVTPESGGAIEYIKDKLVEIGFSADVQVFGNSEYKVTNLYAHYGEESPNICFAGHIDVVPPGDLKLWNSDPFIATQINDKIFGRGAVDMKGAIACMLTAAHTYIETYPQFKGTVSFLITSDEEGEGKFGTVEMLKYLQERQVKIDLAIVGEPTAEKEVGDIIKIGRRGSINFMLKINGKQGHVAYPNEADNPHYYVINILHELINLKLDQGNELFQSSNLEVISIDTDNKTSNVIPAVTNAKFNIRFNNLHNSKNLKDMVVQIIEKYTKNYELEMQCSAEAFIQKPTMKIITNFRHMVASSTGAECRLSTSGGTSDARFIVGYCPVIECGLLSKTAHMSNEYVEIKDLQTLYNVYYNCLDMLVRGSYL